LGRWFLGDHTVPGVVCGLKLYRRLPVGSVRVRTKETAEVQSKATLRGFLQTGQTSAESLHMALNAMPVGVAWANLSDLKITFMNRKFTEIFGYGVKDVATVRDWIALAYPFADDRALARATWRDYFAAPDLLEREIDPIELRVRCKDGSMKTIIQSGVILPKNGWALSAFVDITERKRDEVLLQAAERQLRENKVVYRLLLEHSPEMIILSPFDHTSRFVSPAVEKITGFTSKEFLDREELEMIHPADRETAIKVIEELKRGNLLQVFKYRALQQGGGYRWVEGTVTGYIDPISLETAGYVATVRDISEQKRREDQQASDFAELSTVAGMDELTGIANRRTFNRTFDRENLRQTRGVSDLSLILLDVDFFKSYNDLYGHLAGDECLQRVAASLQRVLKRDADLVARFGGEEFVVLLPVTGRAGAEAVARSILSSISALAIPHAGSPHGTLTVSMGVSSSPAGIAAERVSLLDCADRSLYLAKGLGRNTYHVHEDACFSPV
jgi:diguanylate cyclase (GGDEF)-like protein/PAS domain S-box-containing protein